MPNTKIQGIVTYPLSCYNESATKKECPPVRGAPLLNGQKGRLEMSWLNRHLNLSLLITILMTAILTGFIDELYYPWRLLIIPVFLFIIVTAIWYLKRKGRSLWWYFGILLICASGAGISQQTNGLIEIVTVFIFPYLFMLSLDNKKGAIRKPIEGDAKCVKQ